MSDRKPPSISEAALTGETFPVEKIPGDPLSAAKPLAKRINSLFMGTNVSNGTAVALVVATGKDTEFGRVSATLSRRPPETEFERGLRRFGYLPVPRGLIFAARPSASRKSRPFKSMTSLAAPQARGILPLPIR